MGNYFAIKEDKVRADSLFNLVYNQFEFDPIRNEAAKQLGLPLYDFNKDPVEDEYSFAESIYETKKYKDTIKKLFSIYRENPKSIYASKSLYTIGYILENNLEQPDSAASIYDTLATKYRTSEYAKAIIPKLTAYKQEQKKLEAIQDSIKEATSTKIDSLGEGNPTLPKATVTDSTAIEISTPKEVSHEPKATNPKKTEIPK
jgi:hypothetical protein